MTMRRVCAAAAAVLLVLPLAAPVAAQSKAPSAAPARKDRATVTVQNRSATTIRHLYLTPQDSDDWGPDQLGDNLIEAKKGAFKLTDIPCGVYDVRLVDDDGNECVVEEVDICARRETWTINDKDLRACTAPVE
jgi:hypothetical protein